MLIKAFKVKASELKPRDLFSVNGEGYWDSGIYKLSEALGEKVYIRTEVPCPKDEEEIEIYKVKIIKNDKDKI